MFGECDHHYNLDKKEEYSSHLIFKFICNKCGKPRTKVVETGRGFVFEVE